MTMQKQQGYTLLELIIVIGLMGLLVSVMLINGVDSRRIQQLENAARQLESAVAEAQAYGNSGKAYPEGGTDPEDFNRGYGVYVATAETDDANKKIIIYGGDGDANNDGSVVLSEEVYDAISQQYEMINLTGSVYVKYIRNINPAGNIVMADNPSGGVLFRRGRTSAGVYTDGVAAIHGIQITLGAGSFEKKIRIYPTGLTYIE